jgi:hypothetical protein
MCAAAPAAHVLLGLQQGGGSLSSSSSRAGSCHAVCGANRALAAAECDILSPFLTDSAHSMHSHDMSVTWIPPPLLLTWLHMVMSLPSRVEVGAQSRVRPL